LGKATPGGYGDAPTAELLEKDYPQITQNLSPQALRRRITQILVWDVFGPQEATLRWATTTKIRQASKVRHLPSAYWLLLLLPDSLGKISRVMADGTPHVACDSDAQGLA
jgi:hypothetical protein